MSLEGAGRQGNSKQGEQHVGEPGGRCGGQCKLDTGHILHGTAWSFRKTESILVFYL